MRRALLLGGLLALVGCTSTPPLPPEDGGGGGQGGGGGAGGGTGGGAADAGPGADLCGPTAGGCDGGSCLLMQLEDGGRGRRCVVGACDLIAQDCDGGFKCDYQDGGRACLADGTLAEGAACIGQGGLCVKGLVCATIPVNDGGYEAHCAKYCGISADCTPPQQCLLTLILPDSNERPQICANPPPTCDLLTQTCVAPADGCYPNGATGSCFPAGTTASAAPCVYSNDCQRGATCVNTAGGATCRPMCGFPSGAPACTTGMCKQLVGTTGVGVCI